MRQAFRLYYTYNSKWHFIFHTFIGMLDGVVGAFARIVVPAAIANYFSGGMEFQGIVQILFLFMGVLWFQVTCIHISNSLVDPVASARFERGMYVTLFTKMNQLSLKFYDDNKFYERFILAASNVRDSVYGLLGWMNSFVGIIFAIATSTVILVLVDAKILIIMGICLVVTVVVQVVVIKMIIGCEKESANLKNISEYIERLFYLKEYATEMRASNISRVMLSVFDCNVGNQERLVKKIMKIGMVCQVLDSGVSNVLMYFMILIYACYRISVLGEFSVGELVALLMGAFTLYGFLTQLITSLTGLIELSERFAIYREFMNISDSEEKEATVVASVDIPIARSKKLTFHHVSFGYDAKNVIKDLVVDIPLGSTLAILGPNGAGKSTFVKLLMRYYRPGTGEIMLDGHDVSGYEMNAYRKLFSCVSQKPVLFELSIAENVLLRKCNSDKDKEAVAEVLKKVGLWDKVQSLPHGIDSIIGKEFSEEGVLFSGGEAQRIAIARTILQNRPFLILDEPSSHLDPSAEYELFQLMCHLKADNTVIFITHNIRNVTDADKIIWFEDGRILEKGSHAELMALEGKYYKAYCSRYNTLQ